MNIKIKTTVGIIAIALGSISFAQAGENRHDRHSDRHYDEPRQERDFHKNERREHAKHMDSRHERFREQRQFRKHKREHRIAKRHLRAHKRAARHNRWKHAYRSSYNRGYYGYGWRHGHSNYRDYHYDRYASPRRSSHNIVINADPLLPIIAGGVIANKIAKKIVRHDPILRTIVRHDPIARAILGR